MRLSSASPVANRTGCAFILLLVTPAALFPAEPVLSRTARTWEFVDATGQQASILGREDGTLETYVYPLKLFSDLQFSFEVGGRVIPASSIARRATFRPGSMSILFAGDEFQVIETLVVPVHQAGGIIRLDIHAYDPVTLRFSLRRDFQLMWPASLGSGYGQWKADSRAYVFGADGQPYRAVLGSPDLTLDFIDYATNYSAQTTVSFSLGTVRGKAGRTIAFGGSMKSEQEAEQTQRELVARATDIEKGTEDYYRQYLAATAAVDVPDQELASAYDWSRLSVVKGVVDNPFLGKGLVAGYGPSKGAYRPGFAWFFGRDSFWSSFALNSAGDWQNSRAAIEFIAKFQRADGKIPHEMSQSATLVPWSKDYPYEYASADATPLFIVAVRDYVQQSGDVAFGTAMWDRVSRALAFSRSTFDAEGFPKNFGVGHGWVEGGPLLPIRVESYMAGCYVEAVRSLGQLAHWTGHDADARPLEQEFEAKQKKLNEFFWLANTGNYAYATGNDGKLVDQPTVLSLVPQWWTLYDLAKAQQTIEHLSEEKHASDWGMRIISSKAALYNPAGYHFGSVWPLFTGWASLAAYRAHEPAMGWANLAANSWLALDGANGNTTEVLSGETYSPLSTASPHQIWSAAMVISPLIRGVFGLEMDGIAKRILLQPHLPARWTDAALRHVPFHGGTVDFTLHRDASSLTLKVENHGAGPFTLRFSPAYSPYTAVTDATLDTNSVRFEKQSYGADWHPVIEAAIGAQGDTITLRHQKFFGIDVPARPPRLAETSSNLKLISERWENTNRRLIVTLSGLADQVYDFDVTGGEFVEHLDGASFRGSKALLSMPDGVGYVHKQVVMDLR
jgi:glycogen debranching enzyme